MGAQESSRKASQSVGSALFGKTQRALLALCFVRPEESFYLRQIVRLAGVGQGAAQRELSAWVDHIAAQDALVRYKPAFLHQVGSDGQAAFVLQIAICD